MVVLAEEAEQGLGDLNEVNHPFLKVILLLQDTKRYRWLEIVKTLRWCTHTVDSQSHVIMDLQNKIRV